MDKKFKERVVLVIAILLVTLVGVQTIQINDVKGGLTESGVAGGYNLRSGVNSAGNAQVQQAPKQAPAMELVLEQAPAMVGGC